MGRNLQGFGPLQYALVLLAMLCVGLVSHFIDGSPRELTFLKVTMTPVMAVASCGLTSLFDFDEAYRRWSPALFERVALSSFVTAASVTLLLARAKSTLGELAGFFASMFVVFAFVATFGPLARRPRL